MLFQECGRTSDLKITYQNFDNIFFDFFIQFFSKHSFEIKK